MNVIAKLFLLFPRRWALKFGVFLGILAFYLFKSRRKLALHNFNLALGKHYTPAQQKNIIKKVFINLSLNFIEFFRFQEITSDNLSQFVTFHGKEYLEQAYREKKGVLVLTGHIGNWELLAAAVSLAGFHTGMVTKSAHQKSFNDFLIKQREAKNIHLLLGRNSLKDILKLLKSGAVLGIVIDQHGIGRDSVTVPFFGRPAATLKGLAVLSERTGAPVVPIYIYRDENFHHHIVIEPALPPSHNTPEESMLQYTQWLESVIIKYPDQWMWTHNRWKTHA